MLEMETDVYELLEQKGLEMLRKMKVLKNVIIDYKAGRINSSEYGGILYWVNEEQEKQIKKIEEDGKHKVVHVINCTYNIGGDKMKMVDYITITTEDLELERPFMEVIAKAYNVFTYTVNETHGTKNWGYIGILPKTGGFRRAY